MTLINIFFTKFNEQPMYYCIYFSILIFFFLFLLVIFLEQIKQIKLKRLRTRSQSIASWEVMISEDSKTDKSYFSFTKEDRYLLIEMKIFKKYKWNYSRLAHIQKNIRHILNFADLIKEDTDEINKIKDAIRTKNYNYNAEFAKIRHTPIIKIILKNQRNNNTIYRYLPTETFPEYPNIFESFQSNTSKRHKIFSDTLEETKSFEGLTWDISSYCSDDDYQIYMRYKNLFNIQTIESEMIENKIIINIFKFKPK